MCRLHPCRRVDIRFGAADGDRCFAEAAGDQFNFSVICANVAGCIYARDVRLHPRVDFDRIFFDVKPPVFDRTERGNKTVVDNNGVNIDRFFRSFFHMFEDDLADALFIAD